MNTPEIQDEHETLSEKFDNNVYLYGDVCEQNISECIKHIVSLNSIEEFNEPINLYLSTLGGDLYEMFALIDVIRMSRNPIHIYALGKIQSAGIVILASGHKKFSGKHTIFMIHGISGSPNGSLNHISTNLKFHIQMQDKMINVIKEFTNFDNKKLNKIIRSSEDYYFDVDEALECGLVDEIV